MIDPTEPSPRYSPALLSAMLNATADNLDSLPIADVVVDALYRSADRGSEGHLALTEITWALRDAAAIVDAL